MPFLSVGHRRVGIYRAVIGCGLLGVLIPLLWAGSDRSPNADIDRPSTVAGDSPASRTTQLLLAQVTNEPKKKESAPAGAGPKTYIEALKAETEQAAQYLEQGKAAEFIEDYFPVSDLRSIREHASVRQVAKGPKFKSSLKRIATIVNLCAKAKPVLSQGDGIATFDVTVPPEKPEEVVEVPQPQATAPVGPLPGFGNDLPKALDAAIKHAKAKEWEAFVLGFYPLQEAQFLKSSDQLKDLLYVIQENPQMELAMLQELQRLQKAKPVLTEKNTIAEYTLHVEGPAEPATPGTPEAPGSGTGDTERVIRLQLTDGHWRMFDFASPVRKQIDEFAGKSASNLPEGIVVKWERLGNRWRLLALDFIEP